MVRSVDVVPAGGLEPEVPAIVWGEVTCADVLNRHVKDPVRPPGPQRADVAVGTETFVAAGVRHLAHTPGVSNLIE
jgi:hypothetical protein